MAIRFRESPESRELKYGANGGGVVLRATAITNAGESEADVYLWVLLSTTPYYNGFIRQEISAKPKGAPHLWTVEVTYGTTGVGGGDQPLGGVGNDGGPPLTPSAPASDTTPLTSGWSFNIRAPRLHFQRSRAVVASGDLAGDDAPDNGGALHLSEDKKKIEGLDWPPEPAFTFTRAVARENVTRGYLETLALIAGRTNDATFYGFDIECVLLLEAAGQYTQGEGWSNTFTFGVNLGDYPIEDIVDGVLPSPLGSEINRAGWHYLEVVYGRDTSGASLVAKPTAFYIHQMVRPVDFALLEIGA